MFQPRPNGMVAVEVVIARPSFCLGEVVQGFLNVIPRVDVPILRISVELVCECQIEICETTIETTTSTDSDGNTTTSSSTVYHYFPYSMELLHTQPVNVYASQSPGGVIFSSPASIPFAIPLPVSGLPSSLRTFQGNKHPCGVMYYLITKTFNPMAQILNTVRCEVKVFECFGFPDPMKPMLLAGEKQSKMLVCCLPTNKLFFYCRVDKTMYCPGDQMKLTYWIKTDTPDSLPSFKHVEVSMVLRASSSSPQGVRLYRPGGSQPTSQSFKRILGSQTSQGPEVGRAYHAVFAIPPDFGPASHGTAPLIWYYTFRIKLKLNRIFDNEVKIAIPIALNGKNAEEMAQTAYALQYASLPVGAFEAQQFYIACAAQTATATATAVTVSSEPQPSNSADSAMELPEAVEMSATTGQKGGVVSYVSVHTVE